MTHSLSWPIASIDADIHDIYVQEVFLVKGLAYFIVFRHQLSFIVTALLHLLQLFLRTFVT